MQFVRLMALHQSVLPISILQITQWKDEYGDPLTKRRKSPFSLFSKYVSAKLGDKKLKRTKMMKLWYDLDADLKEG